MLGLYAFPLREGVFIRRFHLLSVLVNYQHNYRNEMSHDSTWHSRVLNISQDLADAELRWREPKSQYQLASAT